MPRLFAERRAVSSTRRCDARQALALSALHRAQDLGEAVRAGDFTITNTPLRFEAGDFVARITFRDDRSIAGLYILNPEVAGLVDGPAAD